MQNFKGSRYRRSELARRPGHPPQPVIVPLGLNVRSAAAQLNTRNFDIFGRYLDNTNWRDGFVVGAGLEYAFAGNWIVGIEYDYMDFGSKSFRKLNVGINPFAPETFSDNLRISTVTGRLSYKFGEPVVAKY